MMSVDDCPSLGQLRGMLHGTLVGTEARAIERHIRRCPDCRRALEHLTGAEAGGRGTVGPEGELLGGVADPRDAGTAVAGGPESTVPEGEASDIPAGVTRVGDSYATVPPTAGPSEDFEPGDAFATASPSPGTADSAPAVPGYEVFGVLGRGGMGVVYRARQVHANREVALKMVLSGDRDRPEGLLRFRLEAESLARLQHPNIVQVYEVGSAGGRPFFSMEYVSGGTLAQALAAGPRPAIEAATLAETLARAVHAAHQSGVVHRDLKPANVLLAARASGGGGWGTPKVTDFGLAKVIGEDSGLTRTGQVMGTPSYMAPEQASGGAPVGVPADVYALGAILYELLAGRPPFQGGTPWEAMMQAVHEPVPPPSRWRPGLPRDLEVICLRCLAKEPAGRYASADALAEDLRRHLGGEPILARPSGVLRRAGLWAGRRPVTAALAGLLVASILAGAAGVVVQWRRAERNLAAALAQEKRAEDNSRLARKSVEDYLTRVSENRLIREPGLQGLREELLGAALSYYRDFARDRAGDPSSRADLMDAYIKVGTITAETRGRVEAAESFRKALEAGGPGAARGDSPALLARRAEALTGLGSFDEAISILQGLVDTGRGGDREILALAGALSELAGERMIAGELGRAEDLLAREAALLGPRRDPGSRKRLARSRQGLGEVLMRQSGRMPEALAAFREDLAVRRELARDAPGDPWEESELAMSCAFVAQVAAVRGDYQQARSLGGEACSIGDRLTRANPRVVRFATGRFGAEYVTGYALLKLGDYREARGHYDRALDSLRHLARLSPDEAARQEPGFTGLYLDLGELARLLGERGAALGHFAEALRAQEDAMTREGVSLGVRVSQGMIYRYLATDRAEMGDAAGAVADGEKALAILKPLAVANPGNLVCEAELSQAHVALAGARRRAGDREGSLEAFREADEMLARLLAQDAQNAELSALRLVVLSRIAAIRAELGDDDGAVRALAEARAMQLAPDPETSDRAYARALLNTTRLRIEPSGAGHAEAALAELRRAGELGFRSPSTIESDPDFAPLRGRADFRDVLDQLKPRDPERGVQTSGRTS